MWPRHRKKEIILFFVILISSKDYTHAQNRNDKRLAAARRRPVLNGQRPRYQAFRQLVKVNSTLNSTLNSTTSPSTTTSTESYVTFPIGSDEDISDEKWDSKDSNLTYYYSLPFFWGSLMKEYALIKYRTPDEGDDLQKIRVCYMIATTYMGALKDLRRYFIMKLFYENNLEYEVGYMTNEIISKYQRMLEMFYIAEKRFLTDPKINYAPSTYMLYMYTNVLEMATAIKHLCHMLKELETKYSAMPGSGFSDYHLDPVKKVKTGPRLPKDTGDTETEKKLVDYEKRLIAERLKREKARKKKRKKMNEKKKRNPNFKITLPTVKPRNPSMHPLEYGWSIEAW